MQPILLEWGSFFIPAWHFFVAVGAMVAFATLMHSRRKYFPYLADTKVRILFVVCYLFGLFGSRIAEILISQQAQSFGEFWEQVFPFGGMVFYGGMLLALLVGGAYARSQRLPVLSVLDLSAPAIFVGLALGRIGCFLNGDDYGKIGAADSIFTVVFPNLNDNAPRFATQLLESAWALLIVAVAFWGQRNWQSKPGQTGLVAIGMYALFRFFIENLRDDPRGYFFGSTLSTSQGISIVVIIVSIIGFYCLRSTQGREHAQS